MTASILFISGSEVFIVMLVILLLFGSKKIPELAKGLGKGMKEFKRATEDIKKELHDSTAEIRKSTNEIQRDLDNVKGKLEEESKDIQKSVGSSLDPGSPYDTAGSPYDTASTSYEAGIPGVYREGEKTAEKQDSTDKARVKKSNADLARANKKAAGKPRTPQRRVAKADGTGKSERAARKKPEGATAKTAGKKTFSPKGKSNAGNKPKTDSKPE